MSLVDGPCELVEPIARYLKYLDICGKARNTLSAYARSLAFYFTFLKRNGLAYERVQITDQQSARFDRCTWRGAFEIGNPMRQWYLNGQV